MPAGNATTNITLFTYKTKWDGGNWDTMFHLSGTFGGGTVQLYYMGDGNSTGGPNGDGFLPITGGAYTEADDDIIHGSRQITLRAILTGATSPDIDWNVM